MVAFRWGAVSHRGRVRPANEDAVLVERPVWVVADGMGGHAAGEVASHIAVDTLRERVVGKNPTLTEVIHAVHAANHAIVEMATFNSEMQGMGTTVSGVVLVDQNGTERLAVLNVGDSRTYAVRNGELHQITRDHSYVWGLVMAGDITKDQARVHPHRNIITKALGIDADVEIDTWDFAPVAGDRYLVCSDGLVDEVDEPTIADLLSSADDPQAAAEALTQLAYGFGGRDNISVVVLDVLDDGDPRAMPKAGEALADPRAQGDEAIGGWLDTSDGDGFGDATQPVPLPRAAPDAERAATEGPSMRRRSPAATIAFFGALGLVVTIAVIGIVSLGRSERGPEPAPATTTAAENPDPTGATTDPAVDPTTIPPVTLVPPTVPLGSAGSGATPDGP
jgi:PPM family protein phosphatase